MTSRIPDGNGRVLEPQSGILSATWRALGGVYDPELCIDVVALGLVYDVRCVNSEVIVEMTMTTPGCPASESLPEMAKLAISEAVGDEVVVDVRVVWEPPWNPTMMDDATARSLGLRVR
ncbi:metal-sulfur cluster assembly factor [Ferrimicrobium acidiphilum]|uniref:Metal-sulfur cluster assembly factor n=1 Tax=Ferrimicrobium acidiphilum TaxID=121039 RepID=A0ABV3Y1T3_9ACTN